MPDFYATSICLLQVLFCRLSPEQRELYRAYLASKDVEAILAGDRNALAGIDVLRKICNHPDLLQVRHTANVALTATSACTREHAQGCHCRQIVPCPAHRLSAPTFACLCLPVSVQLDSICGTLICFITGNTSTSLPYPSC